MAGFPNSFAGSSGSAAESTGPLVVEPDGKPGPNVAFWLETSLNRIYPTSEPGDKTSLSLIVARNSTISFQACLRNRRMHPLNVECSVEGAVGLVTLVRRVGYIPLWHVTTDVPESDLEGVGKIPGLVPDPLFPETTAMVGPDECQSFWVTLRVPENAEPGMRDLTVRLDFHDKTQHVKLEVQVEVIPFTIQPRRDFPVTHWWRAEAIYHHYKVEPFGEEWFRLTRPYLENLISHGTNVIFVPAIFPRRETFEKPAQMVRVTPKGNDQYEFDFTDVRRFIRLAKECGAEYFEWPHFWIYWGVKNPVPIYEKVGNEWKLLWPTDLDGFSDTFRLYLKQYLEAIHEVLVEEDILDKTFFHLSDEPGGSEEHLANYRKARAILREYAPWMKVMDALSDIRYGREGLTDMPIPSVNAAPAYISEKIPHWVYYCCGPRGEWLNRFCDTPLQKIRMSGWLFYRLQAKGFLHWGYNYWYQMETENLIDPFTELSGRTWPWIPYGDPFVVYPGGDGPLDSIRWEVFAESLQDYAILQTAGIQPDDPLLAPIRSYAEFPRDDQWIQNALMRILKPGAASEP